MAFEGVIERIDACKEIVSITRPFLGPNGKRNIFIKHEQDKLFFNDAEIHHPAARILVLAAKEQQVNYGDGVNLVVLVAGQLLESAKDLIVNGGVDPKEIINAYRKAFDKAGGMLKSLIEIDSEKLDVKKIEDVTQRMKAPAVCVTDVYMAANILCPLIAKACIHVCPKNCENFNGDNVRVAKLLGRNLGYCETIKGCMVLKADSVVGSIEGIEDAKVVVIAGGVDTTVTETKGRAEQLENSAKTKTETAQQLIEKNGAKVIVIGPAAVVEMPHQWCNDRKIMVLKIASESELKCFRHLTFAETSLKLRDTTYSLGHVDSIKSEKSRGARVTVINAKGGVSTVLLGESPVEMVVDKGVNIYKALCMDSRIVPGAGATEIEIARLLKAYSLTETGSDQKAIAKYAESFEVIPKTLAENAYIDAAMNIISTLYEEHKSGNFKVGIDLEDGACKDASTMQIWDLYSTKHHALRCATNAVCNVLDFDKVVDIVSIKSLVSAARRSFERTCQQYAQSKNELATLLERIMSPDGESKKEKRKWLGMTHDGDKIFGLTPSGRICSYDKHSFKVDWSYDIGNLLRISKNNKSSPGNLYIVDWSMIFMFTTKLQPQEDTRRLPNEAIVLKRCEHENNNSYLEISQLVLKEYFNPKSGERVMGSDVLDETLCVKRSDLQFAWYQKSSSGRGILLCNMIFSSFDVSMFTWDGMKIEKPLNDVTKKLAFRPTKVRYSNLPWRGRITQKNGGEPIVINHTLGVDLVCVGRGCRSDDNRVLELADTVRGISDVNSNILKVYGVVLSSSVYNILIQNWGTPLSEFIHSMPSITPEKLLKLIWGLVNGIRGLHDKEIYVGNLSIKHVFVDKYFNVKISPMHENTRFPVTLTASSSTNFSSNSATPEDDMVGLGDIIFFCFTGVEFNKSIHDLLKPTPGEGLEPLYDSPNALDLVKKLHLRCTAKEASAHNILWSPKKDLQFMCAVAVRLEDSNCKLHPVIEGIKQSVFGSNRNWCITGEGGFPMKFLQIMEDESWGRDLRSDEAQHPYNYTEVFPIFKLVRNLVNHLEKILAQVKSDGGRDKDLKEMFGKKGLSIWFARFFKRKLPKLMNEAYNVLKPHLVVETNFDYFYQGDNLAPPG